MKSKLLLSTICALGVHSIGFAQSSSSELKKVCKEALVQDKKVCSNNFKSSIRAASRLPVPIKQVAQKAARTEFKTCKSDAESAYNLCMDPPVGGPEITIDFPANGEVITQESSGIAITGTINDFAEGEFVLTRGLSADIDEFGNFSIEPYLLSPGTNEIEIILYEATENGPVEKETIFLNVEYVPVDDAGTTVGAGEAAVLEVLDQTSPIFGAVISVPSGATDESLYFSLESDPEHVPNTPIEFVKVGEPVTVGPLGEIFNLAPSISIPYDPDMISSGVTPDDLRVLAISDDGWTVIPSTIGDGNTLDVQVSGFVYDPFIVVAKKPIGENQVLLESDPAYATIYLDGVNTGKRSPALVDVPSEGAQVKLYLETFNELFSEIDPLALGGVASFDLIDSRSNTNTPVLILDQDLGSITSTTESLLDLSGTVSIGGAAQADQTVIISLNGKDSFQQTNSFGQFEGAVALKRGLNRLNLRTTGPNGETFSTETYEIALGSPDITINLSWNSTTDIDLHVFDPNGAHAYWENLSGIPNGMIDRDDTDGFGPEIFTLTDPPQGTYRVAVNAYDLDGASSARATLEVRVGNSVVFNENYTFTSGDENAGNGQGNNSSSFWNAHEFEIAEINITRFDFQEESQPDEAIFTTDDAEDEITVTYDIPPSMNETDLMLAVSETNETFDVPTDTVQFTNGMVMFDAAHQTPTAAAFSVAGSAEALTYEVIISNPTVSIESEPQTITQEERSKLRQEYVDKEEIGGAFNINTPDRADIITAANFPGSTYFGFNELSGFSDYGPGLAVMDQSLTIADAARAAWGRPVRVTSGFRNPRRNDSLAGSARTSLHQSGDAVDLNPTFGQAGWPMSPVACTINGVTQMLPVTNYLQAQRALVCVTDAALGADYDIFLHVNHLHGEYDP